MESESEQSFTRWAGDRQLALLRTAVLLTGDHHRAEDLVQDALTKVASRWSRLRDGNPDAYARQVIVHTNSRGGASTAVRWSRRRRAACRCPTVVTRSTGGCSSIWHWRS